MSAAVVSGAHMLADGQRLATSATDAFAEIDAQSPRVELLPNGLGVIVIELPTVHRVVIDTYLRTGSRYESTETNGLCHFLEHMLYRGSPSHPSAQQLALAFESLGGMLLASTATDSGSMSTSSPPENFSAALGLYAEVFQHPVLAGIEVEKNIVMQEILEGLDERGRTIDPDNLIRSLAFPDHPLGLPITGTIAQLERFDRDLLRTHHQRHYTARNSVMAVAGPVKKAVVLQQVAEVFAKLPAGDVLACDAPAAPAGPRFLHVKDSGSQVTLRVAFRAPSVHSLDEPAVEALLRLIDDGMSTRLYRGVCDDKGLCYEVSASYEAYVDSGLFELRAETTPNRVHAVMSEVLRIVQGLSQLGPEPAELQKAQRRHFWQVREMLDSPDALGSFFALGALHGVPRSLRERHEQLAALQCDTIRAAATRLFRPENLSAVVVGQLSNKERTALEQLISGFTG
jgi:predicted Zn-dependent peptidase